MLFKMKMNWFTLVLLVFFLFHLRRIFFGGFLFFWLFGGYFFVALRSEPFGFGIEVDDDRGEDRYNDEAIQTKNHREDSGNNGMNRIIAKANGRDDRKAVPQGIPDGGESIFHVEEGNRESDDHGEKPNENLRGIGFTDDLSQNLQPHSLESGRANEPQGKEEPEDTDDHHGNERGEEANEGEEKAENQKDDHQGVQDDALSGFRGKSDYQATKREHSEEDCG